MRILVTVGTTPFDHLIKSCEEQINDQNDLFFQIATGKYVPKHAPWMSFGQIDSHYKWADYIICHAGAGTVYPLLECGRKLLVVPNLERRDHHQQELARYLQKMNFCEVLWQVDNIGDCLSSIHEKKFQEYSTYKFCLGKEISEKIRHVAQDSKVCPHSSDSIYSLSGRNLNCRP